MVFFSITLFEVEFKSNKVMNVQNIKLDSKWSHLQGEFKVKNFYSQTLGISDFDSIVVLIIILRWWWRNKYVGHPFPHFGDIPIVADILRRQNLCLAFHVGDKSRLQHWCDPKFDLVPKILPWSDLSINNGLNEVKWGLW